MFQEHHGKHTVRDVTLWIAQLIYLKNKIGESLMNKHKGFEMVGLFAALALSMSSAFAQQTLTRADCQTIINQAVAAANAEDSLFRPDPATTKMHIACIDRQGKVRGFDSMADAWAGSIDIARAKAYTALAFSSNQNALSTRDIGCLSQPGGPLWQIGNSNRPAIVFPGQPPKALKRHGLIEFPGGLPLYKGSPGELVGGIGVSGDGVDQDENVAEAGAVGFETPAAIRSDTVLQLPYTDDPDPATGDPCK